MRRVGDPVGAHVYDHRALLHHVRRDEAGLPYGNDEDVRRRRDLRQVPRPGVDHGHGRVGTDALLDHHGGHGLAYDVAPSDDHHVLPSRLDARPHQHLLDAGGRGGEEVGVAYEHPADVPGMEAVDVLRRVDGVDDGLLVDVVGQWELHQEPVDRRVRVELRDLAQKLLLRGLLWHPHGQGLHPELLAHLALLPDVDLRRGVVPHEDHCKARRDAFGLQGLDSLSILCLSSP